MSSSGELEHVIKRAKRGRKVMAMEGAVLEASAMALTGILLG